MADALISPAVGLSMVAVSGVSLAYCAARAKSIFEPRKIALAGVMGAFVFAAQMLNFSIPGTGSSGHVSGAIFLSAILGPWRGFISMACILAIQALFFADGGLLAYGCNLFNMGFWSCLVSFPLIYSPIARGNFSKAKIFFAGTFACVAGAELGALSVVLETLASDTFKISAKNFLCLMLPIHLAIGVVEGIASASLLCFIHSARPELLEKSQTPDAKLPPRTLIAAVLIGAFILAALSVWASEKPDGLEWSLEGIGISAEDAPRPSMEYGVWNGAFGSCLTFILLSGAGILLARRKRGNESV